MKIFHRRRLHEKRKHLNYVRTKKFGSTSTITIHTENPIPCQIQFTAIFYAIHIFEVNLYRRCIFRIETLTAKYFQFNSFTLHTFFVFVHPRILDRSLLDFFLWQMVVSTSYTSSEQLGGQSQSIPNNVSLTATLSTVGTRRLAKISKFMRNEMSSNESAANVSNNYVDVLLNTPHLLSCIDECFYTLEGLERDFLIF